MATNSSIRAWRIPMDREAWRATVHRAAKSRTRLSTDTDGLGRSSDIHLRCTDLKSDIHIRIHLNHCAISLKLTQHCKSTILQ